MSLPRFRKGQDLKTHLNSSPLPSGWHAIFAAVAQRSLGANALEFIWALFSRSWRSFPMFSSVPLLFSQDLPSPALDGIRKLIHGFLWNQSKWWEETAPLGCIFVTGWKCPGSIFLVPYLPPAKFSPPGLRV